MADTVEQLILRLLTPDNEVLSQGFNAMRTVFKNPEIDNELLHCLTVSENPQVREYAGVLLRRKYTKSKPWRNASQQAKQNVKQTILQTFLKETDPNVVRSVTELMSSIAKHELLKGHWPELMQLLNQCILSSNVKEKEMGLYAMCKITDIGDLKIKTYLKNMITMFSKCLLDTSSINVPFYAVECLTHLVCYVGTEEMNLFQNLIPSVMQVIKNLVPVDESKACKCLEIFDALIECEVAIVVPHIKPLIGFCLEIASAQNLQPEIRVKALTIVRWVVQLKNKTIIKHKLIQPILNVLFPIMCQTSSQDGDNLYVDSDHDLADKICPIYSAGQVIDIMALHLPPEKLVPPLMHHLDGALKSEDPNHRKAAYLALSVIAEGCSEYIRNKGLRNFLEVICKGLQDENMIVRNPALYCLEQFAEYLQPDINKFAPEILPLLFQYFDQSFDLVKDKDTVPPCVKYTFYALETFCENMGDDLLPYLPVMMERLLNFLASVKPVPLKEIAISSLGSVALSVKEAFVPYFPTVIENLKVFISERNADLSLKVQSIDTLSILARSIGNDVFMPMAHDSIQLGLQLVEEVDDPDIRRCVYNLFSSVSLVLKTDMSQYVSKIVEHMISSLVSTEGINMHHTQDENLSFALFEDNDDADDPQEDIDITESDEDEEEDDDDEIAGFSVENAYMEEKEAACCALKEISTNTGMAFVPHLNKCFDEVKKFLEFTDPDIRREAIVCLGHFCIALQQSFETTGSLEYRLALDQKITLLFPKLLTISREDTQRRVVLSCLETIQEMVDSIKSNFVNGSTLDSIVLLIKDVFKHKLACQDEGDEDEELDEDEAEYDMMLFQYAGNIIPSLLKALPTQQVTPHFAGLMPFLLPKTKQTCTVSDKSFSLGTLAEAVSCMESGHARPYLPHLLPAFIKGMADEDDEVRSNSVYGLGVLVENVGETLFPQYATLLQSMSSMISREESSRAKDNLCSTLAKMMVSNSSIIPMKEVFPVFLHYLPLQIDMDENASVYKCLSYLHSIRCEEFFQNIPVILKILSTALATQNIETETVQIMAKLVQVIFAEFPADFETVVSSLEPENVEALKKCCYPNS